MFIVHLAGHLGKDPETRFTPSGQKVTTFSIATNQRKGKEDVTTWVRVTIWGDRFDKLLSFLKKGSGVIVTGRMNPPNSYTDKEGRTQFSLEVTAEMIEFSPFGRNDREGNGNQQAGYQNNQDAQNYVSEGQFQSASYAKAPYGSTTTGQGSFNSIDEDALPF